MFLAPVGDPDVLALDRISQPGEHPVPSFDGADEVANFPHYGLDGVVVTPVTKSDDLLVSLACLQCHAHVGVDRRGTGDVGTG